MLRNAFSASIKKFTFFHLVLIVILVSASVAIMWAKPAKAAHAPGGCPPIQFTRCSEHGYFTNAPRNNILNQSWVWNPSRNYIDTSQEFIDEITDDLNTALPGASCPNDITEPCVQSRAATVGAAFIIATMLGENPAQFGTNPLSGAVGVNWARQPANYNRWRNLVNQYTAQGLVDYDLPDTYAAGEVRSDSLAFNYGADVFFYQNAVKDDTSRYIVFRHPTNPNLEYRINKKCGNVTGIATPLVPPPPIPDYRASCDVDAPTDITRGSRFNASFTVTNTGRRDLDESDMAPPDGVRSDNNPVGLWGKQNFPVQIDPGNTLDPGESSSWGEGNFMAPNTTGSYRFWWRIFHDGDEIAICRTTVNVSDNANRPILRVNGGDIFAGANFGGYDRRCTSSSPRGYYESLVGGLPENTDADTTNNISNGRIARQAHIDTWGNIDYHTAGDRRYTWLGASSSQYAVFSSGEAGYEHEDIDFDRAHLNHILANDGWIRPTNPDNGVPIPVFPAFPADGTVTKDAVFSNSAGKGGRYGAFYADFASTLLLPCVDIGDYTSSDGTQPAQSAPATDTLIDLINRPDPVLKVTAPGGYTIPAGDFSVPVGRKKVIIIEGDLNIRGNIRYPVAYGNNVSTIPFLQLVATGKINIFKSSSQIDAHLLAFPRELDPDDSGILDTCADANANTGVWPAGGLGGGPGGALTNSSCPNQLVVNGSLIARRVYLKRTLGTMSNDIHNLDNSIAPHNCRIQTSVNLTTRVYGVDTFDELEDRYRLCAAELVNFYPESYIANMGSLEDVGVGSTPIDSFELPPIY